MTSTGDPLCLITPASPSVLLHAPHSRVQQALRALQAKPSATINGLEHYDEAAVVDQAPAWPNECCASDAKQLPLARLAPR